MQLCIYEHIHINILEGKAPKIYPLVRSFTYNLKIISQSKSLFLFLRTQIDVSMYELNFFIQTYNK
jgi:hypothetical protein